MRKNGLKKLWLGSAVFVLVCLSLQAQTALTPAPVNDRTRKALLEAREAIWRAKFLEDLSLIPPDVIGIVEWTDEWKHRDDVIAGAKTAAANGLKIIRLEFPKTEIQLFGDTAILYSTYIYEAEFSGRSSGLETGRATEVFILRNGKWLNAGWHIDSGTHLAPREGLRKELLDLRESIWRAYFNDDSAFLTRNLRSEMIVVNDEQSAVKRREDLLIQARLLADQGVKLASLEFPHTEIRVYEQTAVLFSDFHYEAEIGGVRSAPVSGHTTEIFTYREGKWLEAGWHFGTVRP
ncbi:MAG TPA: nuclear transport factor 2 family protein [Candidatus Angelobacter sp.]|nr:nuclear transport factor 2 family protein [Candidatus Angelobacter sp.]